MNISAWPPENNVPVYCEGNVLMSMVAVNTIVHAAHQTDISDVGIHNQNFVFTGLLRKKAEIPIAPLSDLQTYQNDQTTESNTVIENDYGLNPEDVVAQINKQEISNQLQVVQQLLNNLENGNQPVLEEYLDVGKEGLVNDHDVTDELVTEKEQQFGSFFGSPLVVENERTSGNGEDFVNVPSFRDDLEILSANEQKDVGGELPADSAQELENDPAFLNGPGFGDERVAGNEQDLGSYPDLGDKEHNEQQLDHGPEVVSAQAFIDKLAARNEQPFVSNIDLEEAFAAGNGENELKSEPNVEDELATGNNQQFVNYTAVGEEHVAGNDEALLSDPDVERAAVNELELVNGTDYGDTHEAGNSQQLESEPDVADELEIGNEQQFVNYPAGVEDLVAGKEQALVSDLDVGSELATGNGQEFVNDAEDGENPDAGNKLQSDPQVGDELAIEKDEQFVNYLDQEIKGGNEQQFIDNSLVAANQQELVNESDVGDQFVVGSEQEPVNELERVKLLDAVTNSLDKELQNIGNHPTVENELMSNPELGNTLEFIKTLKFGNKQDIEISSGLHPTNDLQVGNVPESDTQLESAQPSGKNTADKRGKSFSKRKRPWINKNAGKKPILIKP